MTSINEANAKFALDFFHLLCKEHPKENIMFSPVNLAAALNLLCFASQPDTKPEIEKILHLEKSEEPLSSSTRSPSKPGENFQNNKEKKGTSLLPTSKEHDSQGDDNKTLSAAETSPQRDVEEDSYFIPWRKHLLGREDSKHLVQDQSSPEKKLASRCENLEEQQPSNVTAAEACPAKSSPCAETATENVSSLLHEFRYTVKHADDNVKTFKESLFLFKECCDNMCTSMSNLQNVLETLIQKLRVSGRQHFH